MNTDEPVDGPTVVSLGAPAKLTLSLRITGVRDDGYHLLDAEMVTLDFGDRIEISDDGPAPGRVEVVERRRAATCRGR
ncbi:MAG: hypothetical protein M5U19_10595 [Microthrixaceae bacterium]|nr:hypothetical protein [Microthrixaceae bacterium]